MTPWLLLPLLAVGLVLLVLLAKRFPEPAQERTIAARSVPEFSPRSTGEVARLKLGDTCEMVIEILATVAADGLGAPRFKRLPASVSGRSQRGTFVAIDADGTLANRDTMRFPLTGDPSFRVDRFAIFDPISQRLLGTGALAYYPFGISSAEGLAFECKPGQLEINTRSLEVEQARSVVALANEFEAQP